MNTSKFNCKEIELMLDAYYDDELADISYQQVESHLASCTECTNKLNRIRQTAASLHRLPRLALERDFGEDLDVLLKKENQQKMKKYLFFLRSAGLAAAACLLIVWFRTSIQMMQIAHINKRLSTASPQIANNSGRQKLPILLPLEPAQKLHRYKSSCKLDKENTFANEIEIANALGNDQNSISETLGCATDEDGLYALKM